MGATAVLTSGNSTTASNQNIGGGSCKLSARQSQAQNSFFQADRSEVRIEKSDIPYCGEQSTENEIISNNIATSSLRTQTSSFLIKV